MNGLYIGIGMTLILALLAALIGPFFVDWGSYRAVFEREATKIVGLPVTVIGEVDARLLPSPRIRFGDVVVGPVETPFVRVGRFELDLEAAPLLKGDVRVSELRLERPAVDLAIDGDGRLLLPTRHPEARDPSSVEIEQIEISGGRLAIADARNGGRFELTRIAAIGSAASLAGPWRLDGGGLRGGHDLSFHLAGGRTSEGATAVKLQLTPADDPATLFADLIVRDAAAGPNLAGKVTLERRGAAGGDLAAAFASWKAEAQIAGDGRAIEATSLTLAIGPEERAAQFTGAGKITLGAEPGFEAALTARQIEFDRLVTGESGRAVVPAALAADAARLLTDAFGIPLPGRLRLEIPGLVAGGGVIQDIAAEVRSRAGGLGIDRLEARLPGRSRIDASGRLAFDGGPRFDGRVEVASEQPSALAGWWRGEAVGDRLDAVTVAATVSAATGRLRADDLRLEVARAKARGHLDWTEAGVKLALAAERLELDQVTRLARLFLLGEASRRPAAFGLDLDAGQMVVGGITAKGVSIGVTVAADDVAIERLTVQDLAGARLSGSGRLADPLGAPRGTLDLTLDAARPEAPARALATLGGLEADAVERIAGLAGLAAPIDLALRLEGRSEATGTALTGSLRGFAGGAEVAADLGFGGRVDDPARGEVKLTAKLAGERAPAGLMRLLGGGAAAGPLAVDVSVAGKPIDGLKIDASGRAGETRAGLEGRAWIGGETSARLEGRVRLATADATAFGAWVGRPVLAFERRIPIDVSALVSGTWPRLDIGEVAGRIAETGVRGAGRLDLGQRPVRLDGRLEVERLELEGAAEALLGGAILGEGPAVWATTPLAGPVGDGAVAGTLALSIGRVDIGDSGLDRARARLVAGPGEVRLEGIEAGFAGGRIGGETVLRRSADGVSSVSGRLALAGAGLGEVVWRRAGRPIASGRIEAQTSFAASGRTFAALVASLDGEGRVTLDGAHLLGLGGEALGATRIAIGDAQPTPEAVERQLRARLEASETDLPRLDVAFALQAGVARSGRLVIETPNAKLTGRAAIDLTRLTLDADGTLEPAGAALEATKTAISKATPSVGLAFRGPLAAPERSLDVAPLVAHLTLSGIERDVEKVEALQQDIAERARQARERRRLEEMRAAEEAAKREAEAKRAAEETARKAAEDAAKKAAAQPAKPSEGAKPSDPPKSGEVAKPAGGASSGEAPAAAPTSPGASSGMDAVRAVVEGASGGSALPPLPPPIVVPPAPSAAAGRNPPLSITPPGVAAP